MKGDKLFKAKRNTNRKPHNECLLDNIVDEDLQAVMFPLSLLHILISLQFVLEMEKLGYGVNAVQTWITRLLSIYGNLRNLILLATLSIACENFHWNIKLAESNCARILGDNQATGIRATCKNVLRLNRSAHCKMSAFGVFDLDAAFPLRLLGGLVAYTVVLLQFAFLLS